MNQHRDPDAGYANLANFLMEKVNVPPVQVARFPWKAVNVLVSAVLLVTNPAQLLISVNLVFQVLIIMAAKDFAKSVLQELIQQKLVLLTVFLVAMDTKVMQILTGVILANQDSTRILSSETANLAQPENTATLPPQLLAKIVIADMKSQVELDAQFATLDFTLMEVVNVTSVLKEQFLLVAANVIVLDARLDTSLLLTRILVSLVYPVNLMMEVMGFVRPAHPDLSLH